MCANTFFFPPKVQRNRAPPLPSVGGKAFHPSLEASRRANTPPSLFPLNCITQDLCPPLFRQSPSFSKKLRGSLCRREIRNFSFSPRLRFGLSMYLRCLCSWIFTAARLKIFRIRSSPLFPPLLVCRRDDVLFVALGCMVRTGHNNGPTVSSERVCQ